MNETPNAKYVNLNKREKTLLKSNYYDEVFEYFN